MLLSAPQVVPNEKQGFSRRLRDSLKRAGVRHGSPSGIAREFNLRYEGEPVTPQAVRKWLGGQALPSQDKMRALAVWLETSPHWLRFGEGEVSPARAMRQDTAAYRVDPDWVGKKYDALNDAHKKMIVELILALLRLEGRR
jgi:transcriptional regulator with XRE-family HTH domain